MIGNLQAPHYVTTNSQNQIIVTEEDAHSVSVFSPEGEKIHSFKIRGIRDGQFSKYPSGVTVDDLGNIYLTHTDNCKNCIQKFTSDGNFVKSIGIQVSDQLQFTYICNGSIFQSR